jgi:fluoride ion exporter CrcB/FEX
MLRALMMATWPQRGTLPVNLLGAFALGALVASPNLDEAQLRPLAIGFLGAFTTFSGWMLEAAERWRGGYCTPGPLGRALCSRVLVELALTGLLGVLAFLAGRGLVGALS